MYSFDVDLFFKQKKAYDMRISDWSSDVCSSDLHLFKIVSTRLIGINSGGLRLCSGMIPGLGIPGIIPIHYLYFFPISKMIDTNRRPQRSIFFNALVPADITHQLHVIMILDPRSTGRSEEHTSELQSLMRI